MGYDAKSPIFKLVKIAFSGEGYERRLTGSWSRRAWVNDRRTEQHPGTGRFPSTFPSHPYDETISGFGHAGDLHSPGPAFGAAVVALGVSIPAFNRYIRCPKQLSLYASK